MCHHNTTVTCANATNHCEQQCHNLPNGRGITCSCFPGYQMNRETKKCEDIDECQSLSLHHCSHICINKKGSYDCECASGFEPSGENRTDCHPGGKKKNRLYCKHL